MFAKTLFAAALVSLSGMAITPPAHAQEGRVELDETVISGNQELPKVLYILPWKDPSGLPEVELEAEIDDSEVFRRLYPPAYRRELEYHESLMAAESDDD